MSNNNYVIREDFMAEIYQSDDDETLNTKEILQDNYDYICKSISDEDYTLENPNCNLFKELLYDNMVVGFVTYDFTKGVGDFALNEIYVLPEYRGNKYFISELDYMLMGGSTISIYEPTHRIIEILLENDYAKKLDDNLVVTSISLDVDENSSECTADESNLDDELIHSCNLYDLNISACILLEDISSDDSTVIHYSRCLDDDDKYYSASAIRKNIDEEYFENIKYSILSNHEKYINALIELEENKPTAEFDIDEIIGRPPQLSEYLESLISEQIITRQKALDIQAQMIDEYEKGLILSESLLKRLEYLTMEDLINEDKEKEGFDSSEFDMKCSYCEFPVTPISNTCDVCGFKLDQFGMVNFEGSEELVNDLIESIREMKNDGLSDEEIMALTMEFTNSISNGSAFDNKMEEMLIELVQNELNRQ